MFIVSRPIASAVEKFCVMETKDAPAAIEDVREVPGYGVEGRWQGSLVRLGRAEWLGANAVEEARLGDQFERRDARRHRRSARHPA